MNHDDLYSKETLKQIEWEEYLDNLRKQAVAARLAHDKKEWEIKQQILEQQHAAMQARLEIDMRTLEARKQEAVRKRQEVQKQTEWVEKIRKWSLTLLENTVTLKLPPGQDPYIYIEDEVRRTLWFTPRYADKSLRLISWAINAEKEGQHELSERVYTYWMQVYGN